MITKETALLKVQELVKRFNEQLPAYKKTEYNETQTRRDFIDPFFKALGWDIDNEQGFAESYREVIHEDRVKVGKATKAPDYSFRIGGIRKFFVEAKKPSVLIKDDIQPAYQVRRYGWSAKLNVSIITDFEEFAIYDCNKKPNPTDKTSTSRIKYITFNEYEKEWDFLWNTFSKEAVNKGFFDTFVKGTANKKGTDTVDKEFLKSLDDWRTLLAETISKENKELDEDELNFVVQQTLDRIIFIRICEDRSIEPYGSLQDSIKIGDYYQNLLQLFKQADDKYNSGLFDFKKDKISHKIQINNKTLKTIITQLYYPESPYEFSVLSVEILGSAYEQFLGKTITINNRGKAVIELKPEVRKAGGVYYTPQYIVDYIVVNTIGKQLENKTPKEATKIKICDPACGSGSFLLGAYQYLLNWHKDYYIQNPNKKNPLTPEGNLTTGEKKNILLNNIYGVDIDTNAVEVTKLSLLLKCMEGETQASIAHQMTMFNERVLPTLENNIKSGNSLVQNSYLENVLDFGEVDFRKVKPFEWQEEFIDVFNQGGFDAVIGNPPYSAKQSSDNKYLASFYKTVEYKCDLFAFFIERGLHILKENGNLGFIIPVSWMTNLYFKKLREHLIVSKSLSEINLIDGLVFDSANIDTNIITLIKNGVNSNKVNWINSTAGKLNTVYVHRDYSQFSKEEGYSISAESDSVWYKLKKKIDKSSVELGTISKISLGLKLRSNDEFVVKEKSKTNPDIIVFGKDVGKYQPINQAHFFNFSKAVIVGGTKNPKIQQAKTKIFIQAIRNLSLEERIVATIDKNSSYFVGTVNSVILNDNTYDYEYILGLINSKLLNTYFKKRFTTISLTASFLGVLPICTLSTSSQKQKANEISKLVEQLLSLNAEKLNTKLQTKISQIESRAIYCMNKIDQIVYDLFELTAAEIKIIES